MNLLLDTHTLIWWLADHPTLSSDAREAIRDPDNAIFISAATVWEIAIKTRLGKLDAPDNLVEEITANRFSELPISAFHAMAAGKLPMHHRDPFDRMLVAQAQLERLTLVTRDTAFEKYGISISRA